MARSPRFSVLWELWGQGEMWEQPSCVHLAQGRVGGTVQTWGCGWERGPPGCLQGASLPHVLLFLFLKENLEKERISPWHSSSLDTLAGCLCSNSANYHVPGWPVEGFQTDCPQSLTMGPHENPNSPQGIAPGEPRSRERGRSRSGEPLGWFITQQQIMKQTRQHTSIHSFNSRAMWLIVLLFRSDFGQHTISNRRMFY